MAKEIYMQSYTPLRYPGGKAKLYRFVEELITTNFKEKPVYVEPYSGGFGLGMKLLLKDKVSKVYINDLDIAIYSFWKSVVEQSEEFVFLIENAILSIDEWKRQKAIYLNPNSTMLEKGFATFYLNRTNRSGIILAGPIGGYNQEGNYKIDCRFNKSNLISLVNLIATKKNQIIISNLDGSDFIKSIDKQESNSLIYLDPPYVERGKELYKNSFTEDNHRDLCTVIKSLNNLWFVTYDDNILVEGLYKNLGINRFDIKYSVQTKRLAKEIVIFSKSLNITKQILL